ncbi:hypothetical protein JCM5296_002030 [Sporobolomyces johnsonii]
MAWIRENLHHLILANLAANLAAPSPTTTTDRDLDLLTASFANVDPEPSSRGAPEDLADADQLTTDQVDGIVAFAQYATALPPPQRRAHADRLLHLLERFPACEIELAVGIQPSQQCAPSDRLAFALVRAALTLAEGADNSAARSGAVMAVFNLQSKLLDELSRAEGDRLVTHVLPALLGLARATSTLPFLFLPSDPLPSFPPPSSLASPALSQALAGVSLPYELETPQSRAVRATLELYLSDPDEDGERDCRISSATPLLSVLEVQEAYWSSFLLESPPSPSNASRWDSLLLASSAAVEPHERFSSTVEAAAAETAQQALGCWSATVDKATRAAAANQEAGEGEGEEGELDQAGEVLVASLRLATVASLVSSALPTPLPLLLSSLLSPSATSSSDSSSSPLQLTAISSLHLLGLSFPAARAAFADLVRTFLLSPALAPLSPDPAEQEGKEAGSLLEAVARCYAALLPSDSASHTSALQTLLNFVATNASASASASASAVHIVARLATSFGTAAALRLVRGALGQWVASYSSSGGGGGGISERVVAAALYELAELAAAGESEDPSASEERGGGDGEGEEKEAFRGVVRIVAAAGRAAVLGGAGGGREGLGLDEVVYRAAIKALARLATVAARRKEDLGDDFLAEVLTLFVHRGTASSTGTEGISQERRSAALLGLLPVLSSYLRDSNFSSTRTVSSSLSALFRSFWYICLLSGFLSPSPSHSSGKRELLREIAKMAPPLVAGGAGAGSGGEEWVEIEAQVLGALRNSPQGMSVDAVRADLASAVPSQAKAAGSVEPAQAVFLATVVRLETLRAEAGLLSPVFAYFGVPSLSGEGEMASTLGSIGEKVLSTYVTHLSRLVSVHSMAPSAYKELRALLLETCHRSAEVRSMALHYLNELLSNFPSLVCNEEVVGVMLELLTVLRRACLAEFIDEYTPVYHFHSAYSDFSVSLSDDYSMRNRILRELHQHVRVWLKAGLTRSPLEMQGLLQEYIEGATEGHRMASIVAEDEMGKSVALDLVRTPPANSKNATLPAWGSWNVDSSAAFARQFAAKSYFGGEAARSGDAGRLDVLARLEELADQLDHHKLHYKLPELRDAFYKAAAVLVKAESSPDPDLLHLLVSLPVRIYTEASVHVAQEVWTWVADMRPELEPRLVAGVLEAWAGTIDREQGLFSRSLDVDNPLNQETQYTPTDKEGLTREYLLAARLFAPMAGLLEFLSSRFQAFRYRSSDLVLASVRLVMRCLDACGKWTHHALSRELRFRFLSFGFCILQGSEIESVAEHNLRTKLYAATLDWFAVRPTWSFGTNRIQLKADLQAIEELASVIQADAPSFAFTVSSAALEGGSTVLPHRLTFARAKEEHKVRQQLLKVLLDDEADRLRLWLNPMQDSKRGPMVSAQPPTAEHLSTLARFAWPKWPKVVIHLPERFRQLPALANEVNRLVRADPVAVQDCPDALAFFIDGSIPVESRPKLRHLIYWAPVPVPDALRFLFPKYGGDPILLQYALRVLEHHPVEVTFFYIPQVVQALRFDELGYAERFIFETSKISQLFCHQIIWNMKANAYRGDDAEEADPMKPKLDRVVDMIVESLSGEAQDFYQREFAFFDEVTSISAKLKPYIKASKPEKKAKIDEEMAKIKVDVGVYLPSNPDGVVVDINRKSGRPLQSHAKAPFMATFKVRRQRVKGGVADLAAQDALIDVDEREHEAQKEEYDTWQSAIFKVGDDCRQDVLALQIIAMHKNIFNSLGLDLLVTPYRVTATGAGCGVIDVVPNATSRDEMGRAKINDLLSFFTMKFGPVDSVEFQRARTNFVQSMAAYSLLCYIVQIKDRHNGNIMIDARGCITHIDFGFLFDIGPGGVKFEPDSFKLSHEMVVLMGGRDSPGFRAFTELTVKAFLAARAYARQIAHTTSLMLAAEFPSFKGEPTIERLVARFRLDLGEKEAAKYMMSVIDDACENKRSIVYDEFQRMTNGIPYVR